MRRWGRILFLGIVAVTRSDCFASPGPVTIAQTAAEANKALVRTWIDQGFNRKDLTAVDRVFGSNFTVNGQSIGPQELKQSMGRFHAAFPNLQVTITELIAEGDRVAMWYSAQGTHSGDFEGIHATGKPVRWVGADILRFAQGRIVEAQFVDDSRGLLLQLGATFASPQQ